MTYNSVAEIFDDIDSTRERLIQTVEGLSDEQKAFRPAPEKWSAAEIVEHLSIVERSVARLLGRLLEKSEAEADAHKSETGARTPEADARAPGETFAPVSIAEFVERSRAQKLEAPGNARPEGLPLADSLKALRDSRAAVRALRTRVERADGRAIRFPHPAWGPLDLYQWLAFVGAHEARHLTQIEALKETMNAEL